MSAQRLSSVVINNYNYGDLVGRAIESALAQTYRNVEIVVVDDGSTDHSREEINRYSDVTPVFKCNEGQASAFTAGISASSGEFVFFLDADDTLQPNAVERALQEFDDGAVVKAHWPLYEMDADGSLTGRVLPARKLRTGNLLPEVIRYGVPRGWGHGLGHAYRRGFLEAVMPVRECGDMHGADSYLCVLAPIFGSLRAVTEPLGCYRRHRANFALGQSVRYRLERDARRYPFFFKWIAHYLTQRGIPFDESRWYADGTPYAWTKSALELDFELRNLRSEEEPYILVDDGLFGTKTYPRARPMMERDGQYWGAPSSDDQAIEELERLRQAGARRIIFAATAFWWLDHYPSFASYLNDRYRCTRRNDTIVAYDLDVGSGQSPNQKAVSKSC